jgi:hypothetical protein
MRCEGVGSGKENEEMDVEARLPVKDFDLSKRVKSAADQSPSRSAASLETQIKPGTNFPIGCKGTPAIVKVYMFVCLCLCLCFFFAYFSIEIF